MIRTANGKVIEIQHNVMTPQPYNRLYQLTGTKGFANKYPVEGYALDADQLSASGVQPKVDDLNSHGFLPETEMEALVEKYQHPILKKYGEMAKEVGRSWWHGLRDGQPSGILPAKRSSFGYGCIRPC